MKSKRIAQEAYEYEHLYGPNMPQFKGDMLEYEEEIQEMRNPIPASSEEKNQ